MKVHRMLSIEQDLLKDIQKRTKKTGFNFSEWVQNEYRNKFMNAKLKEKQIKQHQQQIETLQKEITEIQEREQAFNQGYGRNERRFLLSIPRLLSEGKDKKALCKRFNLTFHKDLDINEFMATVKFFEQKTE